RSEPSEILLVPSVRLILAHGCPPVHLDGCICASRWRGSATVQRGAQVGGALARWPGNGQRADQRRLCVYLGLECGDGRNGRLGGHSRNEEGGLGRQAG